MRQIITVFTIMALMPVFGQNHFIGLKSGLNLTNINSPGFLFERQNRIGFNGGLTYEYQLNERFNLGIDLLYFQKGFRSDITFTDELGNMLETVTIKYNFDYVSLPIKGGYVFGDKIAGFINLGMIPSILINAKTIMPAAEGITEGITSNEIESLRKFELGGLVEVGANYKIKPDLILSTTIAYQNSITSIANGGNTRNHGMALSIEIKYALKK